MTPMSPAGDLSGLAPAPPVGPAPVALAPAPPPAAPALPSPSSAFPGAGAGTDSLYGVTPDSVIPDRISSATQSSFNQGGSGGGSSGPAVNIENYHAYDGESSAGQDIARHTEASYAAQSTPGAR
jgi:hypothetical protein